MRRLPLALALALGLLAGACNGDERGGGGDGVRVVAGFYPLAEAARRVGGDRVAVDNLTPAGAEPHDIELSPRQVDRLEDADLVLYLGGGFQPPVETVARRRGDRGVDLLAGLASGDDPHVWLDPTRMAAVVDRVQEALARVDPAGAAGYRSRADALRADLAALDAELSAGLADCPRRLLVTSHAAFGYLAARYGLEQEAVSGLSPEAEPDPRRLAQLADLVRSRGVTTVFTETLVAPDVAETLAREAGATTAVLDPLESLSEEAAAGGADYFSVMRDNLRALRAALGCR